MSLEFIQQAIRYMEEHLNETVSYAEIAEKLNLSSYQFHRTFSFIVGMTPMEYIRNRRLTLAAQELQTTDISVIDAAYKYGYESPESFSKAFSRFHGSTPKQAKQKGTKLHLFNPLVIKIILEGGSIMDYRIEHKEGQKFLARVERFIPESVDRGDIPKFWDRCAEENRIETLKQLRPEGKKDLYGICSPIRGKEKSDGYFNYGIGVLVDENTDLTHLDALYQQGYTLLESEPADYAVFSCVGKDGACVGEVWSKFYKEFIPQTGYKQAENEDYELYFEKGKPGEFCELWIPVEK